MEYQFCSNEFNTGIVKWVLNNTLNIKSNNIRNSK